MAFTKLYLTNRAAPYTPATIRGAWDQTAGAVTLALDSSKVAGGVNTSLQINETSATLDFDALIYRGVSGPLAAQTFGGTVDLVLARLESNAAADMCWHVHIYITQGDSDTPRGTLLSDYVELVANEWPTTATAGGFASAQTLAALAITAGDRMVVEIGYVARNSVTTSYGGTLRYGCSDAASAALADLVAGDVSPDITTRAGHLVFSAAVTEGTVGLRVSDSDVEVLAADVPTLRVSDVDVELLWGVLPDIWHTQTVVEVLHRNPPAGGGVVPGGVLPAAALIGTAVSRTFVTFRLPGASTIALAIAETTLNDPSSWFGGLKYPWLLSVGTIDRALSPRIEGVQVTLEVSDVERWFRRYLVAGTTVEILTCDDDTRYALGVPYRRFAGVVTSHRGTEGLGYEIALLDVLTDQLTEALDSARVPAGRLTLAQFPGMNPQYDGKTIPLVLGVCSDTLEAGNVLTTPQGVVPPVWVGEINLLTAFGGSFPNVNVLAGFWTAAAIPNNGIEEVYFNTVDDPYQRIPVPPEAWGTVAITPGFPGWAAGFSVNYVDYPLPAAPGTHRFVPFYILSSTPYAQYIKDGRVLMAANIYGISENADGPGLYLSDAPRIAQWLLANMLFTPYEYGAYAALPTIAGYSVLNTDSVTLSTTRLRAYGSGSYPVGRLLGHDGQQQTLRHVLEEICADVLMETGKDRHGRVMFDVEDIAATTTFTFSAQRHILEGSFETWVDRAGQFDTLETLYGRRYVPPVAPVPTPPVGETLPAKPQEFAEWTSGLRRITHAGAVAVAATAGRARPPRRVEFEWVRSDAVAASVGVRMLARAVGPSPRYEGSWYARWQVPLIEGSQQNGLDIELGSVGLLTNLDGIGPSPGYNAARVRVLRVSDDLQARRRTLEARLQFEEIPA